MAGDRPAHPLVRDLLGELRRHGYVEGRNFILERRSAEGRSDRHEAIIAELLQLKVDALVTVNIPLTLAAKKLTSSVPIVFVMPGAGDPVEAGVVSSLARPGANITGYMADAGPALSGKRLQLLRDAFPHVSRVAFLGMRSEWNGAEGRSAQSAAEALGIALFHAETRAGDYAAAFEAVLRNRADALLLGSDPVHFAHREPIAEFATRSRLPDMHAYTNAVRAGGLMSYGGSEGSGASTIADYLRRILRGTRPADLPVQRPRTFTLAVNLKAARARGLQVSQALLLRADEVIE
jgi:putative ABC transport system substrate-binding protein